MGQKKEVDMAPVSNFRRILPQILAVAAKNTLVLNFGLSIAFPTIVIPALMRADSDIAMTPDQISWFGSLYFVIIPFGCLASGPLTHKFGRKTMMLALCAPFAGAWLMFARAFSPAMLFGALALHGFMSGLMESPILTYVGEVCEPSVRGPLASTTTLSALIGVSLQFLLANFLDWRSAAFFNIAGPVLSFCCLLAIPESPHWLVVAVESQFSMIGKTLDTIRNVLGVSSVDMEMKHKGWKSSFYTFILAAQKRMSDVEKSLCWLRGWVPASHVQEEVQLLQTTTEADKTETPFAFAPYKDPTFFKPFALVVFTFFVGHFGGMSTLQTYAVSIFDSIKSPIDPYVATTAEGFIQFGGATVCVLLLPFVGRRTLAITCTLLTAVLLAVLVVAGEGWPAVVSLLASVFLINTCSKVFPWVLIGEVFTPGVRATASGMATCIGYAMGFIVNKSWFFSLDLVGLRGMFISYAVVSLLGAVIYFLVLPETEGRTLEEVQAHFRGELDLIRAKHGRNKSDKEDSGQVNTAYSPDV